MRQVKTYRAHGVRLEYPSKEATHPSTVWFTAEFVRPDRAHLQYHNEVNEWDDVILVGNRQFMQINRRTVSGRAEQIEGGFLEVPDSEGKKMTGWLIHQLSLENLVTFLEDHKVALQETWEDHRHFALKFLATSDLSVELEVIKRDKRLAHVEIQSYLRTRLGLPSFSLSEHFFDYDDPTVIEIPKTDSVLAAQLEYHYK